MEEEGNAIIEEQSKAEQSNKPKPKEEGEQDEEETAEAAAEPEEEEKQTLEQKIRFYTSAFFVLLATFSATAFVFCVPFVLDPALSTYLANFLGPVNCTTIYSETIDDKDACKNWTSCREGCTRELFECDRIWVEYTALECNETLDVNITSAQDIIPSVNMCTRQAKLFVNVKQCGYAPSVQCWKFWQDYGNKSSQFPCYYSSEDYEIVITDGGTIDNAMTHMVVSFVVPIILFAASMIYIAISYCACCKRKLNLDKDQSLHSVKSQGVTSSDTQPDISNNLQSS